MNTPHWFDHSLKELDAIVKLCFEAAQIVLTVAAFGYAAIKTENTTIELVTNVLQILGAAYVAVKFSAHLGSFTGYILGSFTDSRYVQMIIAIPVIVFSGYAGVIIGQSRIVFVNALLVTLG